MNPTIEVVTFRLRGYKSDIITHISSLLHRPLDIYEEHEMFNIYLSYLVAFFF